MCAFPSDLNKKDLNIIVNILKHICIIYVYIKKPLWMHQCCRHLHIYLFWVMYVYLVLGLLDLLTQRYES